MEFLNQNMSTKRLTSSKNLQAVNDQLNASQPALYSVILPTYNEKQNLPLICELLRNTFNSNNLKWEIVIVDDDSPDGTGEVAGRLQNIFSSKHLKIVKRSGKLGLGSAYRAGLTECKGDFVILMDADFSHHPKFIPTFIKAQSESNADVVTGTRYIDNGGVYGWDLRRKLTSRVANYIATIMLGHTVSDLTGSFRLYKRDVIENIMRYVKSTGYVFQMEIIVRAKQLGYSIIEVPITFVDRQFGESKLGKNEILQYLKGLFKLFWEV